MSSASRSPARPEVTAEQETFRSEEQSHAETDGPLGLRAVRDLLRHRDSHGDLERRPLRFPKKARCEEEFVLPVHLPLAEELADHVQRRLVDFGVLLGRKPEGVRGVEFEETGSKVAPVVNRQVAAALSPCRPKIPVTTAPR
jgi:hypothetical protein